jgi:hypothetical protein
MTEQRDRWATWAAEPPVPPSGLFPGGPVRPSYREPHPVRTPGVLAGIAVATLWLLLTALLTRDLRGYAWAAVLAGAAAWGVAAFLVRLGDRGVAVGVAVTTAVAWGVAAVAVAARWAMTGDWPMW